MINTQQFYINGQWSNPLGKTALDLVNPSTVEIFQKLAMGNEEDAIAAIQAAKAAFGTFSETSIEQRLAWLDAIKAGLIEKSEELAEAIS